MKSHRLPETTLQQQLYGIILSIEHPNSSQNHAKIATNIASITRNNPEACNLFSTKKILDALLNMANSPDEFLRQNVAESIANINFSNSNKLQAFSPKLVMALVNIANSNIEDATKKYIAIAMAKNINFKHDPIVHAFFIAKGGLETLIKISTNTRNDQTRIVVKQAVEAIIANGQENKISFEVVTALIKMANKTEDFEQRKSIAAIVTKIRLSKLDEALKAYKAKNPLLPNPKRSKDFLSQCMTMEIENGINKIIVENISPILQLITKDPQGLELIEKVLDKYLPASQTEKGWLEMCALISIVVADDKIEAAKHLLAFDTIKKFVAELHPNKKLEKTSDAQAANALLIAVHRKLLEAKQIKQPWLVIPKISQNSEAVSGWLLNPQILDTVCTLFLAQTANTDQIVDHLCSTSNLENWANAAFSEHVASITSKHSTASPQSLQSAIRAMTRTLTLLNIAAKNPHALQHANNQLDFSGPSAVDLFEASPQPKATKAVAISANAAAKTH